MSEAKVFSAICYVRILPDQVQWPRKVQGLSVLHTFCLVIFGRFTFGLLSAPDDFQRAMTEMFKDIEKCEVIVSVI